MGEIKFKQFRFFFVIYFKTKWDLLIILNIQCLYYDNDMNNIQKYKSGIAHKLSNIAAKDKIIKFAISPLIS